MTAPGQVSASERVDAVAANAVAPRLEVNSRRVMTSVVRDDPTDAMFADYPELVSALARVFDPMFDRILWEAAQPERDYSACRSLSLPVVDNPLVDNGEPQGRLSNKPAEVSGWFSAVRAGTGLQMALGLTEARHNLGQEHWIVVVASASNLFRSLSHELIERFQLVESRFLIVAVDDGESPATSELSLTDAGRTGQFDLLDARWLSELGVPCCEPAAGCDTMALLDEFQQIVQMQSPAVLHLRRPEPPTLETDLPTESQRRGVLRLSGRSGHDSIAVPSPGFEAAVKELQALARTDPRVFAVIPDSPGRPAAWRHAGLGRNRVLPETATEMFSRLRGIALGGCRPFLIVDAERFEQSIGGFRDQFCDPAHRITLVVSGSSATEHRVGTPSPRATSPLAWLQLVPNLTIAVPADRTELGRLMQWSIEQEGPVAIQLPENLPESATDRRAVSPSIEIGKAVQLSHGFDVALVALGPEIATAQSAAGILSQQGISAGVISARFVQPLDLPLLLSVVKDVRCLMVIEEEGRHGGFGAAVLERLAEEAIATPVIANGHSAQEIPIAPDGQNLEDKARRVAQTVLSVLDGGSAASKSPLVRRIRTARRHRRQAGIDAPGFAVDSDAMRREREQIDANQLSPTVTEWSGRYAAFGQRNEYLWKWCLHGVRLTTLPCVPEKWQADVNDTKLASIILCVLFDDVADEHGSQLLLKTMLEVTRDGRSSDMNGLTPDECRYVEFTRSLWREYVGRARKYPCYEQFSELLQYDLRQFFNTMCYSQLLNSRPSMLNLAEHNLYTSHNMQMISFSTLDLMCSEGFVANELGKLRVAMWHAQCMGRIGNLLSTWRREIAQRDFTSGIFARAIEKGDVSVEQLSTCDSQAIESAILEGEHERYFFQRWLKHRTQLRVRAAQIHSVDLRPVISGHDRFFLMHLGCRGLI